MKNRINITAKIILKAALLSIVFAMPAFASYIPFNTNVRMNVGIGSANPGQSLDVQGTVRATAFIGNGAQLTGVSSTVWTTTNTNDVYLPNNGNVGIGTTITSAGAALSVMNGNVGIGTWVPAYAVDVKGAITASGNITTTTGNIYISTGSFQGDPATGFSIPAILSVGGSALDGYNGSAYSTGVYLKANGPFLVGINTYLPTSTLTILNNGTNDTFNAQNSSGVSQLIVKSGGNVGIGTTTPVGGLAVMNGNVGIGTWIPSASLDVLGTISSNPSATTNITAGGGITVTRAIMRIQGSGGAVTVTANPEIAAGQDGQVVVLEGMSSTNTVKLTNGTGLKMAGGVSFTLDNGATITFIYDAVNNVWTETSRSAN